MRRALSSNHFRLGLIACLAPFFLSGCANKPLPEQVTYRYRTIDIVDKIRCEAKNAIYEEFLNFIAEEKYGVSPESIAEIRKKPNVIKQSDIDKLPEDVRRKVERYYTAVIAYDFRLNMSVNNTIDGSLTLQDPWQTGLFSSVFTGKNERTRRNERTFRVNDTFAGLFNDPPAGRSPECGKYWPSVNRHQRDYSYPITGNIGLSEMINTFWNLSERRVLKTFQKPDSADSILADEIVFTTKNSVDVKPAFTFSPSYTGLHLTALSGGSSNYREDIHSVIVALAVPDVTKVDEGHDSVAASPRPSTNRPPASRPSATRRSKPSAQVTPSSQSTLDSANQALDAIILRNRLILNGDDLQDFISRQR